MNRTEKWTVHMLAWDYRMRELKPKLEALSESLRKEVALGCLDFSLGLLMTEHSDLARCYRLRTIGLALRLILGEGGYGSEHFNAVESEIESIFDEDKFSYGEWEIFTSLSYLLQASDGDLSVESAYAVMSFSYQSVLEAEITRYLDKEILESQLRVMEERNEYCCLTLDFQATVLERLPSLEENPFQTLARVAECMP